MTTSTPRTVRALAAALALTAAIATLGSATASGGFRAGFAVRSIVPPAGMMPHVRHVSRRTPTGVLPGDGIWARAAFLDDGSTRLGVVSLDLLGLFYDDISLIRDSVRSALGDDVEVIVASTHSHASIDTLGIYGPNEVTSGIYEPYQQLVRDTAAAAVIEAAGSAVPVTMRAGELPAPAGLNEYDTNRHPGSFDDTVTAMQFRDGSGTAVGTIVNWASHPELINPKSSSDPGIPPAVRGAVISSDYVHTLRTTVEQAGGGTALFLNGPVGAVTALAMRFIDPDTGTPFPEKSVKKAYYMGERIGQTALDALASPSATDVTAPALAVTGREFDLHIENPFILALKVAGTVDRQTYEAGQPVPFGRDVRTQMVHVRLGPVEILTVPGELHPDVYTGGYRPVSERANPDVPPERPIEPQMAGRYSFVIGLGQDELGYFVPALDYVPPSTVFPLYGQGEDRFGTDHYQETLSLGRDTARRIAQIAASLLGFSPEPDYEPYAGGFLDATGEPVYRTGSSEVRGIWADTSGSGRYERTEDTELFTPLPAGAPAAYGFLDSRMNDLGTSPSPAAVRGAWVDGDGDGSFDARRDPHVLFDTYHVGEGELSP